MRVPSLHVGHLYLQLDDVSTTLIAQMKRTRKNLPMVKKPDGQKNDATFQFRCRKADLEDVFLEVMNRQQSHAGALA